MHLTKLTISLPQTRVPNNAYMQIQDYLAIMSTSVPYEQLFSLAGLTTKSGNSLDNETVRNVLCLKSCFTEGLTF